VTAVFAGTRPHVDYPVAIGHDKHVVFDDDHRVALFDESVELRHQSLDVRWMQASRGLVEDVERRAALGTL
jgi:hypothetical protein